MKYQIVGKNIVVTDAIRRTLEKKLSRMDKYFVINDTVDCRAVVSSYRDVKSGDNNLHQTNDVPC